MPVTDDQMAKLAPYIAGAGPDDKGEVEMFCPLHPDGTRSASLNVRMAVWYCHAGCGGSSVRQLINAEDTWVRMEGRTVSPRLASAPNGSVPLPTLDDVRRWHKRLLARGLDSLYELRGITKTTARKARLGWDGRYFKIPVFDPWGAIWNVRTYDPRPTNGRRKIWSVKGMGRARLYPIGVMRRSREDDAIIFAEGEWDALLALQAGMAAVTRTDGAGKPWHEEWTELFDGRRVFICGDADEIGVQFNETIAAGVRDVAAEVRVINLPYPITADHGKDLSDYLLDFSEDAQPLALGDLMNKAREI